MKYKSWNEFWGEFLQVTFHKGHPELWPSRERKVEWFIKQTGLQPGAKILDMGCGDGIIDILLSRLGYEVTSVDRNSKVLEVARTMDDTQKVNFVCSELQDFTAAPGTFDAVLFIETTGLMSKADDSAMIAKAYSWLKPGGKVILDCPEHVDDGQPWSKDYPEGTVRGEMKFNANTRVQNIQFFFKPINGEEFGIHDPYDKTKSSGPGIIRYLYPKTEMTGILENIGFKVQEVDHYYPKNYYGLMGTK